MKKLLILLIIILIFTILYGYYQFSNNITNSLVVKEGLISLPEQLITNIELPKKLNELTSITSEGDFINFISTMYSICFTGKQNSNLMSINTNNQIKINADSIVLISNYSHLLNNIHTQSFNNLSVIFPNMIQNMYDMNALSELYYSSYTLNRTINNLVEDNSIINNNPTDNLYNPLSDPSNYIIYNSLLGFLNKFSTNIKYFNNKYIPPANIVTKTEIGDDYNTQYINK
jgi:hypothetical protein